MNLSKITHFHITATFVAATSGIILGLFTSSILHANYEKLVKGKSILPKTSAVTTTTPQPQPSPTPADFCLTAAIFFYHHVQPLTIAEEKWQKPLSVDPIYFRSGLQYLKNKGYSFISLKDFADALTNRRPLPEKTAVITLDDGYYDNFTYALPIAKEMNIPITIALITGFIGKEDYLTYPAIQKMLDSGLISFVSHSWSHQSLHGTNTETINLQVQNAHDQLEKITDQPSDMFIYPYGRTGDQVTEILRNLHYKTAFTTEASSIHCLSKALTLPRYRMGNFNASVYGL